MKAIKKATINQIKMAQNKTEGATFANLTCRVDSDGDSRWNGCWLMGGEAMRGRAVEPKIHCLEECALVLPVEGI